MKQITKKQKTKPINKPWHSLNQGQLNTVLDTSLSRGLLPEQVSLRQNSWGKNILPKKKKDGPGKILFRQLKSPLIYILLIAAVLTFALGEFVDMTVILLVVGVNSAIGFFQDWRASQIFEKLQSLVKIKATVIRDGENHEVDSNELVPGDLIMLKAGNKVPADCRLLNTQNLQINEALLTGESEPVKKITDPLDADLDLADRENMAYMGTVVEEGAAQAMVVTTGTKTEIGKITILTQETKAEDTPLQKRMKKLGTLITQIVVVTSIVILLVGIILDHSFTEMITTSIAVAVAAIPEGLPAAISVILAISSQRILKRKGLVMRLVAAETLGSTSVICTDKTGTLTYGQMRVEKIFASDITKALNVMALANEAVLEEKDGDIIVHGEATDKAKMDKFLEHGGNYEQLLSQHPRQYLLPFDPDTKIIASFHKYDQKMKVFVSGAPEKIIDLSDISDKQKLEIKTQYEKLAKKGYRMIGLAEKVDGKISEKDNPEKLAKQINSLEYIGLAAIRDPIREDVFETLQITKKAGIKTLIITGDHLLTAEAIADELGFKVAEDTVITGAELDNLNDTELKKKISELQIIARAAPHHKMRVIKAWQSLGAVVAMTGDGVNDAPALKAADIGVSVGSGTDVTKETADLILLDDSFNTIVAAVRQGRISFQNIKKVTILLLSNAFSEIILILSALVLSLPFPITAVQILWVNLVEGSLPALALAFEPGERGVMQSPPIDNREHIVDSRAKTVIFAVGLITDIVLVGIFLYLINFSTWPIEQIRTFIFASIGLDTLMYIFAFKSLHQPFWKSNPFNNKFLLTAAGTGLVTLFAAVYWPFLNHFLETVPLGLLPFAIMFGFALFKLFLVEIVKHWYRSSN